MGSHILKGGRKGDYSKRDFVEHDDSGIDMPMTSRNGDSKIVVCRMFRQPLKDDGEHIHVTISSANLSWVIYHTMAESGLCNIRHCFWNTIQEHIFLESLSNKIVYALQLNTEIKLKIVYILKRSLLLHYFYMYLWICSAITENLSLSKYRKPTYVTRQTDTSTTVTRVAIFIKHLPMDARCWNEGTITENTTR